jgi:beta-glucosidase/6-phospho-beta-glucosidase/beta-galactosidase
MSPEDADRELDAAAKTNARWMRVHTDYATFAATVVIRNRDRVSDWEIWNEPNLPRFLGFAERQAAVYTGLLKAAYPAINPCNRTPRSSPPG